MNEWMRDPYGGDFVVGEARAANCYCCCLRRNLRCLSPATLNPFRTQFFAFKKVLGCWIWKCRKKKEISEKYVMQKKNRLSRRFSKICWRRKLKIYFSSLLSFCCLYTHRLSSSTMGDCKLFSLKNSYRIA